MKRRDFLTALAGAMAIGSASLCAASAPPPVEVYKNPDCGCCGAWVEHMRAAGFTVKVTEVADTAAARKRAGMPDEFASCHTATVAGYALEGHVPAIQVKRLLSARPVAVGLAVPGMPASSPGMDVPGRKDPYQVLLIDKRGGKTVFASYPQT